MFNVIARNEKKFLILGPNNNFITITISTINDVLNRHYRGNLNSFLLFQNDVRKEAKTLKSPSDQSDFTNNIHDIWERAPESVRNKYELLLEEHENLRYDLSRI